MLGSPRLKLLRFWLALMLGCALVLGAGLAHAIDPAQVDPNRTTDWVPPGSRLGQEIYLQTCGTCHIALPPAIMPTETWRQLIQDPQHYGQVITPPIDPGRQILWNYLQLASVPSAPDEPVPYRIEKSRIFKALHPDVTLPKVINLDSCAACHPGAGRFDFRSLSTPN